MTKTELLKEIEAMATLLAYAKSSIENDYLPAAETYLVDIECEAIRLAADCQELAKTVKEPIAANFFHPNDPAYVPYTGNE